MNSRFQLPPTSPFSPVLQAFWQTERRRPAQQEIILPKGVVEVIFNLSDNAAVEAQLGDKQYRIAHCFINGFNTAPILLHPPEHQVFFGVQFKPLAVRKIFSAPAGAFLDSLVDLTLLDSTFRSLWHQLAEQPSFEARVAVFLRWIERKFPDTQPRDTYLNDFLLDTNQYHLSVTTLARTMCYSTRHLSRKIMEATGLNTEAILLYKKYLRALHCMHHTDLNLTEIAYECQFSDQSHFIKSFKAYTHMTPGAYRRRKSAVPGHVFEDVR